MSEKQELDELQAIKKLLILLLLRDGATSETVGRVLGVDSSRIRQMVPVGEKKAKGD